MNPSAKSPLKMHHSRSLEAKSSTLFESLYLNLNCAAGFSISAVGGHKLQDLITPEHTGFLHSGEKLVLMSQLEFLKFQCVDSNYTNYLEYLTEPRTQKELRLQNETAYTKSCNTESFN